MGKNVECPQCHRKGYQCHYDDILKCNYCEHTDENLKWKIAKKIDVWVKDLPSDQLFQKYVYQQLKNAKEHIDQISKVGVNIFIMGRIEENIHNFLSYLQSVKPHEYIEDYSEKKLEPLYKELYKRQMFWKCMDYTREIESHLENIVEKHRIQKRRNFQKSKSVELFGEEIVMTEEETLLTIEDYIQTLDDQFALWNHNEALKIEKS